MSHIETVSVIIKDLESLKKACQVLGVNWNEGKKTYAWYGRHVGSEPIPFGFQQEDLGKCEHVISVPKVGYEVGVVRTPDGSGYTLLYDFYGPGQGLLHKFGKGLVNLVDRYTAETLKKQARMRGYSCKETIKDGKIHLTATQA